jgi:aminomethyltransferase
VSQYSPLHELHKSAGAKLADFGGWEMPIEYPAVNGGGVLNEHQAVRQAVGVFDVSHLGKVTVQGEGALAFLNSVLTNDLQRLKDGQAQYNLICDPASGGVIDDLIAYRFSEREIFLIPNAANTAEVVKRLNAAKPAGIEIRDRHREFSVLALQGPRSNEILNYLGIANDLDYMSFKKTEIEGFEITLCRTGYTGELGYEILTKWDETLPVWNKLLSLLKEQGGQVAGLGARDTLRTEMGYPLHGHELSMEITPVEASAGWAVAWEKEFWGKSILQQQKANKAHRTLQALMISDRGIPRAGMKVLDEAGQVIGEVTSGTFSPTLKTGIALALMNRKLEVGSEVVVDVRGRSSSAVIKRAPLVESHVK